MKSLNTKIPQGCPFKNSFFTEESVSHLLREGFEWRDENDSYSERRGGLNNYGCYKKYENGNGTDIFIYICEDGIEIDQDYDCGGNMNSYFIKFDSSFEEAYDKMVDYVNRLKN